MDERNTQTSFEADMPEERAEIIEWLKAVKFRRKLFGGVDERTVWRKLLELDSLYTKALEAERIRYDAKLEAYKSKVVAELKKLKQTYGKQPGGEQRNGKE